MLRKSFKFMNIGFTRTETNSKFITIICHNPYKNFPHNFNHLIELSDEVVLADGGANSYLKYMKTYQKAPSPAFLTGDMDSIKKSTLQFFEANNTPILNDPNQDTNDLEKALSKTKAHIIDKHAQQTDTKFSILIWGLAGHRYDQLL